MKPLRTDRHLASLGAAGLVLLMGLAPALAAHGQEAGGRLPTLSAENLNERAISLPAGLPAERTLVFIAFSQDQQGQVDTWISGLGLTGSTLPWLELPVIAPQNAFVRAMIGAGMRRGITDLAVRERVVTVFVDPAALRQAMGLPGNGGAVLAAVLDRSGRVLGMMQGVYTAEKAKALLPLLEEADAGK